MLNYSIRDLPQDRIRFHLCWGSWHGPHTTDIPMKHLIDSMLKVKAYAYSFEAANVRHEHEWKLWKNVKLPDGKVIMPGVVTHSTNVIEHPEVVADRIVNFAEAVGRRRSSPRPTAGSADACIRRWRGPSSKRSRKARTSPRGGCGPEREHDLRAAAAAARRAQRLNASIRTAVMADNRHGRPRAGHRSSFRRKTWMRATSARMTVESRCVHSYSRHGRAPSRKSIGVGLAPAIHVFLSKKIAGLRSAVSAPPPAWCRTKPDRGSRGRRAAGPAHRPPGTPP